MKSPRLALATLSMLVLPMVAAPSKPPAYSPFLVASAQFFGTVHKVVVAPIALPPELVEPCGKTANSSFQAVIEAQLASKHFVVIPDPEAEQIAQELTASEGGFIDPSTGKVDQLKYALIQGKICSALCSKYGADAVVLPSVVVEIADVSQGTAYFCGAKQNVFSGGRQTFQWLLSGPQFGKVAALCLQIEFADASGQFLYRNYGGIQALSTFTMGKRKDIPFTDLFQDHNRDATAISLALASL